MRIFIFGQTNQMARDYLDLPGHSQLLNMGARPLVEANELRGIRENITVYLVGDWEVNPKWHNILQELRLLANVCVVKMFVAKDALGVNHA